MADEWDILNLDLPSALLRTPFAQARRTYGDNTGKLISSRYQELISNDEDMAKIPEYPIPIPTGCGS